MRGLNFRLWLPGQAARLFMTERRVRAVAGKILPGASVSSGSDSEAGGREFSTRESKTLPGWTGFNPYDHQSADAAYLRDGAPSAEETAEIQTDDSQESDGGSNRERQPDGPGGPSPIVTWDQEPDTGDPHEMYVRHMANLAMSFKQDLMLKVEEEMTTLSEQSKMAASIETERKNTLSYAMAAYGEDANLQGISSRAMAAQQTNSKELVGPMPGLSFRVNQALSGGHDSMVMLPNGSQVEMDSRVATAVALSQSATPEERGEGMLSMFKGYVKENDPTFLKAMETYGGLTGLVQDGELQFDRGEEEKLKQLWDKVVEGQKDVMEYEAKPLEELTPQEYAAMGLDPTAARQRRFDEYGDPSEKLQVMYSHEFEYKNRRLPTPYIISHGGMEKEKDDPVKTL